jgi:hypothetical protein
MKIRTLTTLAALALVTYAMSGCMTVTRTTTTYPDGRVDVVETRAPAPGAIETAGALAGTAARLAAPVRREK